MEFFLIFAKLFFLKLIKFLFIYKLSQIDYKSLFSFIINSFSSVVIVNIDNIFFIICQVFLVDLIVRLVYI